MKLMSEPTDEGPLGFVSLWDEKCSSHPPSAESITSHSPGGGGGTATSATTSATP
eukprot:CAMPEP_0177686390 /NCGR_PEP_ID=MMETSP0447-20121125/33542_1 /TAXON_ID=0 /ORGANISM="Stygamoeba regulata, Strain BSH-02190019" /LENGTH=54 /DNA_ID=CAMNT_0019196507 /DNA_START=140 /DNA_END=301 /DNA_ORIENTATION=-